MIQAGEKMRYLDFLATKYLYSEGLSLLLSDGVEQEKIRAWCKRNPHNEMAELNCRLHVPPEGVTPCEGWEASLSWIAFMFSFSELNSWEIASSEVRIAHGLKVAKAARELASALEEHPRPYYPPVFELFNEDIAVKIIKSMSEEKSSKLLEFTKHSEFGKRLIAYAAVGDDEAKEKAKILQPASKRLSIEFGCEEAAFFPELLRNLAVYAEGKIYQKKRAARPNTGNANARTFAVELADSMKQIFNRTPNEVIAACVCLKYPELENPPNADTIRDWRGAK